jgi:hypothetical protein
LGIALLIATFVVGAALLALWCFSRWPGLAPTRLASAMLHAIFAFAGLQVGLAALGYVDSLPQNAVPVAALLSIVPVLTYAFLAGLWVLRLFADAFKNA